MEVTSGEEGKRVAIVPAIVAGAGGTAFSADEKERRGSALYYGCRI